MLRKLAQVGLPKELSAQEHIHLMLIPICPTRKATTTEYGFLTAPMSCWLIICEGPEIRGVMNLRIRINIPTTTRSGSLLRLLKLTIYRKSMFWKEAGR